MVSCTSAIRSNVDTTLARRYSVKLTFRDSSFVRQADHEFFTFCLQCIDMSHPNAEVESSYQHKVYPCVHAMCTVEITIHLTFVNPAYPKHIDWSGTHRTFSNSDMLLRHPTSNQKWSHQGKRRLDTCAKSPYREVVTTTRQTRCRRMVRSSLGPLEQSCPGARLTACCPSRHTRPSILPNLHLRDSRRLVPYHISRSLKTKLHTRPPSSLSRAMSRPLNSLKPSECGNQHKGS
jgi:hypothetical protein